MALINCSECSTEVSDKASACQKCGAPIKKQKESLLKQRLSIKEVIGGLFVVGIFIWWQANSNQHSTDSSGPSPSSSSSYPHIPADQQELEQTRIRLYSAYQAASDKNQIQASSVFNVANKATDDFFQKHGTKFNNWTATIEDLTTSHGGATASLNLTSENGASYRLKDDAEPSTALYQQLSVLREGQKVYFSGEIIPSSLATGIDRKWEQSLTESGSLQSPEFKVSVSYIGTTSDSSN